MTLNPAKKTILVTGIGGMVGQGILRNIRHFFGDQFYVTGTDINAHPAGKYFCDKTYMVPYSYHPEYLNEFHAICDLARPDIIIPATDYEVFYLSREKGRRPFTLTSPPEVTATFLDKLETWRAMSAAGIPFATTVPAREYSNSWKDFVVKPARGSGSRGVRINPTDLASCSEEDIVQPLLTGVEITVAFYVTRQGNVLGPIVMQRSLALGSTLQCTVTEEFDGAAGELVRQVTKHFQIIGPCNFQAMASSDARIIPFEFNCRYSGTNSIRAHFGFPDVAWGIREYLLGETILAKDVQILKGSALRFMSDIIYPGKTLDEIPAGDRYGFIF